MKKLVSAVTIAALTAGALSAEVKIGLQSRTRPSLYTKVDSYAENADYDILFDFSNESHTDDFSFETKSDYAGAKLVLSAGSKNATYTNTENYSTTGKKDYSFGIGGDAYAWIGWGNFKLYGGEKSHRGKVNRLNRFGLVDSDTAKYGVSTTVMYNGTKKFSGTFLKDFNDFGTIAGDRHTAMFGEYSLKDALPGELTFAAGLFATTYNFNSDYAKGDTYVKDGSHQGAGYAAMVSYAQKGAVNADLVFKMPTAHDLGFGVYASTDAVENLSLALGFTYGMHSEYDYYKDEAAVASKTTTKDPAWNAFAVDFRAAYKVTDPLELALAAKYSSVSLDGYKKSELKNNALVSTKDELGTQTALNLALGAKYVFNETAEGNLTFGLDMADLDDEEGAAWGENTISIKPDFTIYAGKNAYLEAAVLYTMTINGGDADTAKAAVQKSKLTIPLCLRCKI